MNARLAWALAGVCALLAPPAMAQEECSLPASANSAIERFCAMREGLSRFSIGDLWGYVDRDGRIAIEPQFNDAADFSEGAAAVKRDELWGLIDRNGSWLIEPRFTSLDPLSHGLAAAEENGKTGYVDRTGRWLVTPRFQTAGPYSGRTAIVSEGYLQHQLIDGTGKLLKAFGPKLAVNEAPNAFGLHVGTVQSHSVLKHRDGRTRPYPGFDGYVLNAREGLAVAPAKVRRGDSTIDLYGAMDLEGRWVIPAKFRQLEPFNDGLAIALFDSLDASIRYGLIDRSGRFVVEPAYRTLQRNERGWYSARREDGSEDVLGRRGELLASFACGETREQTSISLSDAKQWTVLRGCDQTWVIHDAGRAFRSALAPSDVEATPQHLLIIDAVDSSGDDARPPHFELWDATGDRVLTDRKVGFNSPYDSIILMTGAPTREALERLPLALIVRKFETVEIVTRRVAIVKNGDWQYDSAINRYGYTSVRESLEGPLPMKGRSGWGAIDADGRWIVPPRYGDLTRFEDGVAFASTVDGEIIVDIQGREYPIPESDRRFERIAPRVLVGRDSEGRVLRLDLDAGLSRSAPFDADSRIDEFTNGLASFRDSTGNFGLIDSRGQVVTPPRYSGPLEPILREGNIRGDAGALLGWRTTLSKPTDSGQLTLHGWLDAAGIERVAPTFEALDYNSAGQTLSIKRNNLSGILALDGSVIAEPVYGDISDVGDGWFALKEPERQGLLDDRGEWAVPPGPLYLADAADKQFRQTTRDGETVLFNGRGQVSTRAEPLSLQPDDPATWWVLPKDPSDARGTELVGVDFRFRVKVPGEVSRYDHFSEGVLPFMPADANARHRIGLMTTTGKVLGLYAFDAIEPMRNGLARFEQGSRNPAKALAAGKPASTWGYLSRAGKVAVPANYAAATDFEEERAAVVIDGNIGLIDTTGRLLLRGAWLCGRDPIIIDASRRILWPAAAREVRACN